MFNNSDENSAAVPDDLLQLSAALPDPGNYFDGRSPEVMTLPLNLVLFRRNRFAPGHEIDNQHHRFMLVCCLGAAAAICVNERLHYLSEGSALLICPQQLHHYATIDVPLHCLFVTFDHADGQYLRALRDLPVPLSKAALTGLQQLLLAARQSGGYSGLGMSLALANVLQEMLLLSQSKPALPTADDQALDVIEKVNRSIYRRMQQPLPIELLAAEAGVSASHLRYLFRAQLGISLGRYIRKVKVHQAMALLQLTQRSVGSIAHACGFASLPAFSRSFRLLVGQSPQAYREGKGEVVSVDLSDQSDQSDPSDQSRLWQALLGMSDVEGAWATEHFAHDYGAAQAADAAFADNYRRA